MRRALVILNAQAGTLARLRTTESRIVTSLTELFARNDVSADVRFVPGRELTDTARDAAADHDLVIAGGGDGTINSVATGLLHTDTPLGVLPLGTLNHLAKELRIPLDLESAVTALCHGDVTDLPIGEVNGRPFLLFSGIGMYADVIKHRDAQRKSKGRRKWPAMAVAAVKMFNRFPLFDLRLTMNGNTLRRPTPLAFVALSDYQRVLFGVETHACAGRDALSIFIANKTTGASLLKLAVAHLRNPTDRSPEDLEALCADAFELDAAGRRTIRVGLDGEVVDLPTPLRYRILRGALKVIAAAPVETERPTAEGGPSEIPMMV
jgi:diacylglycerol kinase family enzyme